MAVIASGYYVESMARLTQPSWLDQIEAVLGASATRGSRAHLLLDVQTPPQHLPYRLLLEGPGWQQERQVQARGVLTLDLPPPPTQPELLTLKLEGDGLRADPSSLGVRVTFDPPEAPATSEDDDEQAEEAAP